MAADAVFSTHHCLGGWDGRPDATGVGVDLGSLDRGGLHRNQKERTCLFSNVCFDRRGPGTWVYFATDDEFVGAQRVHAGVDVWARGDFAHSGSSAVDHTFELRRSALPLHAEWLETTTLIKLAVLAPSNFGHLLGNGLYPAFVAAWRFFGERARTLPVQLLFVGNNQTDVPSMLPRCLRWAGASEQTQPSPTINERAVAQCTQRAALVSKFVQQLLPGLTDVPLLWENVLRKTARHRSPSALLCAHQLIVGTGDLGFSTVHHLANSSIRRRPPQPLWGTFIDHMLRRFDRLGIGGLEQTTMTGPRRAVLIVKHGRRALHSDGYAQLRLDMERGLGLAVDAIDVANMPLREQLTHVRRSAVGVTPDGGASFVLAFLPAGGSLIVLGWLERWLWANDGRLRAFYCQPRRRDSRLTCSPGDGPAVIHRPAQSDCYALSAVQPCIERMLGRALRHARLSWPNLGTPGVAMAPATSTNDLPVPLSSPLSSSRGARARRRAVTKPGPEEEGLDDFDIVTEANLDRR
jgi:hypothetical protein